jgi:very-short-patch-repair endonuclease
LVIEIDGESHANNFHKDIQKQRFLESIGITVLRFNDVDVKKDIGSVLMALEGWIERNNPSFNKEINNPLTPFNKGE